ncbi:MAG TPA: hypothetical protein VMB34_12650 [Acetobacteraceae bacterium]|nr:hypothetical protein [Acetobacteraceae bacterium]
MSQADPPAADLVNRGFLVRNAPGGGEAARAGRTFIVTGLHRSGTTLVASMLRQVGIFMGSAINDIVHEDEEAARLIECRDRNGLRQLIAGRNAAYGTWGFKLPMLCGLLDAADMGLFHNPHVIVTFRDPLAIALRASLSEYRAPMPALRAAAEDMAAMVEYVGMLACPTLLLSYEKALVFPGDIADAVVGFCGLPRSEALRRHLIGAIEPNRATYLLGSRRRYEGRIEGIAGGRLYGWCRLTGCSDPIALELLVDDRPAMRFVADALRQDLREAGFGDGRHGFFLDLAGVGLRADAVIRIRVAEHGVELDNSGRRLGEY